MNEEPNDGTSGIDLLQQQLQLNVYVIDAGWNTTAHHCLVDSLPLFRQFLTAHNLYVLDRRQSVEFLKRHPMLMGKDPVVAVVDNLARKLKSPNGYGARLCLGLIDNPALINWLVRMFLRIINTHVATLDIAHTFRFYSHKEGIRGAVEIIMENLGGGKTSHH